MKSFKTQKGTELPLLNLKGKDYLQVAHRLVWFREEHPDWGIVTEFVEQTPTHALARATIYNDKGMIVSTAHKLETKQGFQDFHEKAETGAVGRALALIGYGTQFAPELEENHRIVDSPLPPKDSAIKIAPKATEATEENKNLYLIPFGKFQGFTLEEVDIHELKDYVRWLKENAKAQRKELGPMQKNFCSKVEEFSLKKSLPT